MRTQPKCKKCGADIIFLPMVEPNGFAKWAPHNKDDRTLHFARCRAIVASKQAQKRWSPP